LGLSVIVLSVHGPKLKGILKYEINVHSRFLGV
jgi:hypothetical protein